MTIMFCSSGILHGLVMAMMVVVVVMAVISSGIHLGMRLILLSELDAYGTLQTVSLSVMAVLGTSSKTLFSW